MKLKFIKSILCFSLFFMGTIAQPLQAATTRGAPDNWQDLLGDMDSVLVLTVDSQKPAKVAIYNCTVKWSLWGLIVPPKIELSFLNFPDAKRMEIGETYLCFIREGSRTSHSLIRSDIYFPDMDKKEIYNYFWKLSNPEAKKIENSIN